MHGAPVRRLREQLNRWSGDGSLAPGAAMNTTASLVQAGGAVSARQPPRGRRHRRHRDAGGARCGAGGAGFAGAAAARAATALHPRQLMSFILDALKKSEAERQRQSRADTARGARHPAAAPLSRCGLIVVGALLGVNCCVVLLASVLRRPRKSTRATPARRVAAGRSAPATRPRPRRHRPARAAPSPWRRMPQRRRSAGRPRRGCSGHRSRGIAHTAQAGLFRHPRRAARRRPGAQPGRR